MTTAAARLVSLAGATGTAGALLLMIGAGATAGAALVDYSGLPSGTAAEHLAHEAASAVLPAPTLQALPSSRGGNRRLLSGREEARRRALRRQEEDWLLGVQ